MTEEVQVKRGPGRPRKSPIVDREPKRPSSLFRMQSELGAIDPTDDNTPDRLRIPPEEIPEGFVFLWARLTNMGQPDDQNITFRRRNGWEPVCKGDVDGRFDHRFQTIKDNEQFTVDGTVGLMYRPVELHKKSQANELRAAREQVSIKEQMLKGGDLQTTLDSRHPTAVASNKISKSYERIDIPKD